MSWWKIELAKVNVNLSVTCYVHCLVQGDDWLPVFTNLVFATTVHILISDFFRQIWNKDKISSVYMGRANFLRANPSHQCVAAPPILQCRIIIIIIIYVVWRFVSCTGAVYVEDIRYCTCGHGHYTHSSTIVSHLGRNMSQAACGIHTGTQHRTEGEREIGLGIRRHKQGRPF